MVTRKITNYTKTESIEIGIESENDIRVYSHYGYMFAVISATDGERYIIKGGEYNFDIEQKSAANEIYARISQYKDVIVSEFIVETELLRNTVASWDEMKVTRTPFMERVESMQDALFSTSFFERRS